MGRVREAKESPYTLWVSRSQPNSGHQPGVGFFVSAWAQHPFCLSSVHLELLELTWQTEEAGARPTGIHTSIRMPSSEPSVPLCIFCGRRDLDWGSSVLTQKESSSGKYFPHIFYNVWSRGGGNGPKLGVKGPCSLWP